MCELVSLDFASTRKFRRARRSRRQDLVLASRNVHGLLNVHLNASFDLDFLINFLLAIAIESLLRLLIAHIDTFDFLSPFQ